MASPSSRGQSPATTVLVIEDEPVQRMHLVVLVEEAGYEVVEAADAEQAIGILERRPDIRIVVADVDMPGSMDGLRLAALVRDRWPPIEIIITSAGRRPHLERIPARAVFLPKPLNEQRMRATLQQFAS